MTKRMLIDASHAEETRVVVLDGNRLEDFDVETSAKRQLKGNIYLAKVVRVEPSLQAAFVEYGGNRHGFLAFSEIHPDYYQIPIADRQRLIEMEAEEARLEEEEEDRAAGLAQPGESAPEPFAAETETSDESGVTAEVLADAAEPGLPAPAPVTLLAPTEPEGLRDSANSGPDGGLAAPEPASIAPAEPEGLRDGTDTGPDDGLAAPEPVASAAPAEPEGMRDNAYTGHDGGLAAPLPEAAQPNDGPTGERPGEVSGEPGGESPGIAPGTGPVKSSDEAGAAQAMLNAGDEPEEPEPPSGGRRRAQPMAIQPEVLSGPLEPSELREAGTGPEAFEATETADESGAILEQAQPEYAESESAVAERPERTRRGRRRPAEDEEQPFGREDSEFGDSVPESPPPETVGGEPDGEDRGERRIPPRFLRNYKIQEVIKRRQIMLVQVVKEERGTKGAALTTYISLAGRFSVLMPNSPRGGGISRKITSATDRRRLKEIVTEMDMPKGMGLIVRTAGANRPKPEIKRDCEYLLRLWDDIREHTLKSVAPALIYEEASLIKRAIRDVYSRDIDEIQVDGETGWKQAHEFMRMLMPSHAKKVQLWRDNGQPLFARYQVEAQLDNMLLPTAQLRSGGYLVINQTEALVAIDVNSGRSTRERNVEETALRTNLEAADEAARQLRLRDLAGLIVIDFIDMESRKHNAMVEKRLKEALKNDRARIQVGHISHFGLLEMSRQRLRPSLAETSFIPCPHCGGMGHIRSTESAALHVLRGIEEEGSKRRAAEIVVHVATPIALYILNHKRDRLNEIEARYSMRVTLSGDDRQIEPQFRIDRLRPQTAAAPAVITPDMPQPVLPQPALPPPAPPEAEEEEAVTVEEAEAEEGSETEEEGQAEAGGELSAEDAERRRRRRRRRRRGRRDETPGSDAEAGVAAEPEQPAEPSAEKPGSVETADAEPAVEMHIEGVPEHAEEPGAEGLGTEEDDARNRRRGRRGGRRRRREPGERDVPLITPDVEQPDLPPVYTGPTPANPFGGHAFDIFDILERAEGFAGQEPAADSAITSAGAPVAQAEPQGEPAPAAEPAAQMDIVNAGAPEPAAEEPVRPEMVEAQTPEPTGEIVAVAPLETAVPTATPAEATAPTAAVPAEAAEIQAVPAEAAPVQTTPAETAPVQAAPAEVAPVPAVPAEAPAVEGMVADMEAAEMAAEPAASAAEPSSEPAIKPILVGGEGEPPAEKKRGWWRR